MITVAVLSYAAVWRLLHSQWISSSMGRVIKVSSRPLQLCKRTLHAEHGRRSSAIRKQHRFRVCKITGSAQLFQAVTAFTFLHHWSFGRCAWVAQLDVAGEVGLALGQVFEQQAAGVAWKYASFGTIPEGGVLLLVRVSGVKDFLTLRILAKRFWWFRGNRILAVHPEVVLIYGAVGQLNHPLSWGKACV